MTLTSAEPDRGGLAGGAASGHGWSLAAFDASVTAEPARHASLCACLACALPPLTGPNEARSNAPAAPTEHAPGPQGAVIDPGVPLDTMPAGGLTTYGNTFKLHSLPSSSYKVYLDFDGFTTAGTAWNSYWNSPSFYSEAYSLDGSESFTATELLRIQQIWQRVAEYFAPFNIDVTTEDPGTAALTWDGGGDTAYGKRVVITDEDGKNYGGIGYVGSFTWSVDTPVYVYANRLGDAVKSVADAAAHETGHSLGLSHDGRTVGTTTSGYYYGHGSGAADWAPVMGVGYNATIVQWSGGDYNGATSAEDDLGIITGQNGGVTYRADDWGGTFGTAGALEGTVVNGVATVQTYGIISGSGARNDLDVFSFGVAAGGSLDLTVSAWTQAHVTDAAAPIHASSSFTMLDIGLTLYDSLFQTVAAWTDTARLDARLTLSDLAGGTYYLAVDGVGWGNPMGTSPTGWTEYGSLGQYMVSGTYSVAGATPPTTSPPSVQLQADRSTIVMIESGSSSVTLRATHATGDILVHLGGANPAMAALSASDLLLNAANNWTAVVGVAGLDNRDVDGTKSFTLQATSDAAPAISIGVTLQDNDIAPINGGKAFGTYSTAPGVNSASTMILSSDNASHMTLREGMTADGAGIDYRWQFNKLTAGDKLVQIDAWSNVEAFRFEYSTDGAATWQSFDGAPASALAWNGAWLATGVGTSLVVRVVDAVIAGDTVRDTMMFDLLTVTNAPTAGMAAATQAGDWMFG